VTDDYRQDALFWAAGVLSYNPDQLEEIMAKIFPPSSYGSLLRPRDGTDANRAAVIYGTRLHHLLKRIVETNRGVTKTPTFIDLLRATISHLRQIRPPEPLDLAIAFVFAFALFPVLTLPHRGMTTTLTSTM